MTQLSSQNPDSLCEISDDDDLTTTYIVEPTYQDKLRSALRSGDLAAIHPFIVEIGKDRQKYTDRDMDRGAAALHLAVNCASVATIRHLLSSISPNGIHPPGSGTTPLHLAASRGRVDVVKLLLEQENIDDSLRDSQGKTCRDVADAEEVIHAIDESRSSLNAGYRSLLRDYILSPVSSSPSHSLVQLLESPRVAFVDLSYLHNNSGASLLYEAVRRKDLHLIELAERAGAELTLRGYLKKYTNMLEGYNMRWFVLKGGVLSYYLHEDDETVACRGSISMRMAKLRETESTAFEVHSIPSRPHDQIQKWYMKTNDSMEARLWTHAIEKSIDKMREGTDSDAFAHHRSTSDLPNLLAMSSPFIFTGSNDLDSWVNKLNDYFLRNDFKEEEKLPKAMEYLSADVRSAIMKIQDELHRVQVIIIAQQRLMDGDDMNPKTFKMDASEKEPGRVGWISSYSRLVGALRGMQYQIEEYKKKVEKARTEAILKGCAIVGGGIATAVALPVVATAALGAIGFSAGGVVAGSAAAAAQSAIGVVRAGSMFAFCQSLAAGGAAMGTVVGTSMAVSSVGAGAASAAAVKAWFESQNGVPSYSWADGERFVPSPELLFSLLHLQV